MKGWKTRREVEGKFRNRQFPNLLLLTIAEEKKWKEQLSSLEILDAELSGLMIAEKQK